MKPIIEVVESALRGRFEEGVLQVCREVGIVVDKERLSQALEDARKFYDEGYRAGCRDALRENVVLCCDCESYRQEDMLCDFWSEFRAADYFCGEGVRRSTEC